MEHENMIDINLKVAEMSKEEYMKYLGRNNISIFRFENKDEILEDIRNA